MNVVSLSCRNCGAPLQIKEEMEQLACVHCGAQMHVERGGGTISLQMVEALGSIRTGAVQTAAELALARLEKELHSATSEVIHLETEIELGPERLESLTEHYKEKYIMSEAEVGLAHERMAMLQTKAKALRVEVEQYQDRDQMGLVFGLGVALCLISAFVAARAYSQNWIMAIWLFIKVFIIGYIVFSIIALIWAAISDNRKKQRDKSLKDTEEQIHLYEEQIRLHQMAVEFKKEYEKATATISQANEKLPEARALVARIEAEIAHNKKIVSLKH